MFTKFLTEQGSVYLKQESYEILIEMKDKMEQYIELNRGFAKMRIQFDFDPMSGF